MDKTKRQHFIPRFILKEFSTDSKHEKINIYLLNQNKFIPNAKLYNQACQDYLYGEDQILEKIYSQLEDKVAPLLRKVNSNNLVLSNEDKAWIQTFVLFQNFRTPEASLKIQNIMNNFFVRFPQLKARYKDNFHGFPNDYYFLFKIASESIYTIADLRIDVLTASSDTYFVIGEHPVIVLNPILFENDWPSGKDSVSSKGAIVLLPVSDRKTLILYDFEMYRLKKKNGIVQISNDDVKLLNYCQFLYSSNCIYTKHLYNPEFEIMCQNSKEFRESDKMVSEVFKIANPPKNHRQELLIQHSRDLPIQQQFEFLNITEFSAYYKPGPTMDVQREMVRRYKREHNLDKKIESCYLDL